MYRFEASPFDWAPPIEYKRRLYLLDKGNKGQGQGNSSLDGILLHGIDRHTIGLHAQGYSSQGGNCNHLERVKTCSGQVEHGTGNGCDESLELEDIARDKLRELREDNKSEVRIQPK